MSLTLRQLEAALLFRQPDLEFSETEQYLRASGPFHIYETVDGSNVLDSFDVVFGFERNFPENEPYVAETGKRLPRDVDRHVYPWGQCCTCVWPQWRGTVDDVTVKAFVNGPVRDFFLSQLYFEQHKSWPFGEWAHGKSGLMQAAKSLLGLEDQHLSDYQLRAYMSAATAKTVKGHWACPCGSGKRLRDCHRAQVEALNEQVSKLDVRLLMKELKKAA